MVAYFSSVSVSKKATNDCWSMAFRGTPPSGCLARFGSSVALRVRLALTDKLYARLNEAPLAWHGAHHPAELAHRLTQAAAEAG